MVNMVKPQKVRQPRQTALRAAAAVASCVMLSSLGTAQEPAPRLKVVVIEGENALNNIREHRARDPVVQVVDGANMPVKGAAVTFLLPDSGPSGEFSGGLRSLMVMSDDRGQATGHGLTPNRLAGKYQIRVVASYQGEMALAVIDQTNAEAGETGGHFLSKKVLIIGVIAGAAAAGAAFGLMNHGGAGATPGSAQPGIVIVSGSPSFQTPH